MTKNEDEQSKDLTELMMGMISEALVRNNRNIAQSLAECTEHGSMVAIGDTNGATGKRWLICLATNDCAKHMEDWSKEQALMRAAAAASIGAQSTTRIITPDDPPPRNAAEDRK
jgi:hypothetical protein